ncbi:hypothetical protein NC652_011259 [Populus alba x Populus x berolinensis]|nr:hypothetical protein NC652_011259 [Populus alba x Populus x berolinensis]
MADENAIPALKSSSSSASSESSSRSGGVGKDDPANPFIEPHQADVESSRGPLFPAEVSSHNLVISYDPNRLSSSIFAKPSNPAEWSGTSNESLFSIYIGNGSFSRDNAYMLYKSGELPKFEETSIDRKNKNLSIATEVKEKESYDSEEMEPESTADINTKKEVLVATEKISCQEKMPPVEEVQVSFSSSNRSFQFPLFDSTSGRTTSFHEVTGKHPSEKHSQQEPPKPAETTPGPNPKAAGNSWFSCFSCCSLGC